MSQITSMARYRAARQTPVIEACRWLDAWERICGDQSRVFFATWRSCLRSLAR